MNKFAFAVLLTGSMIASVSAQAGTATMTMPTLEILNIFDLNASGGGNNTVTGTIDYNSTTDKIAGYDLVGTGTNGNFFFTPANSSLSNAASAFFVVTTPLGTMQLDTADGSPTSISSGATSIILSNASFAAPNSNLFETLSGTVTATGEFRLVETPLPGSSIMFLTGLLGLGGLAWRKRISA
jgi:hypothetical protein